MEPPPGATSKALLLPTASLRDSPGQPRRLCVTFLPGHSQPDDLAGTGAVELIQTLPLPALWSLLGFPLANMDRQPEGKAPV